MEDLKDRTRNYSLRIIRLYDALPARGAGRVIGDQLLRSGTSVGAHFREAIRARLTAEYAAKMNAGLMELEETLYWIELLEHSAIVPRKRLVDLETETGELTAILVTLIKNSKRR
jgi:four helix bundle protein